MTDKITIERWLQAQEAERKWHDKNASKSNYLETYKEYFVWLGINPDLHGKSVIEIGCADFPALTLCLNYNRSVVIEPMPSQALLDNIKGKNIDLIKEPAEYVELEGYDECWILNVLQHVISPKELVENMKNTVNTIRFFEPVNMSVCLVHPHNPTMESLKELFGDVVQYYPPNPESEYFHKHECGYGIWKR